MAKEFMFEVSEGLEVPFDHKTRRVDDGPELKAFLHDHKDELDKVGCYIFAGVPKNKRKAIPIYIGKTAKLNFGKRCFMPDERDRLNHFLSNSRGDKLWMYLVTYPTRKGKNNNKAIDELETTLIQWGVEVNPDLYNAKKITQASWGIYGVLRSTDKRARKGKSATAFRELFQLD